MAGCGKKPGRLVPANVPKGGESGNHRKNRKEEVIKRGKSIIINDMKAKTNLEQTR